MGLRGGLPDGNGEGRWGRAPRGQRGPCPAREEPAGRPPERAEGTPSQPLHRHMGCDERRAARQVVLHTRFSLSLWVGQKFELSDQDYQRTRNNRFEIEPKD